MKEINEDFIKDTAKMFANIQSDEIKLNYKDGVYYGYMEGFKKALELVKNNGVLDDVIVSAKDCRIPMREFNSDKCLICGKKFNEH